MPKFRATVRLSDLKGTDPKEVLQSVEEGMKQAGFEHWRVIGIDVEGAAHPPLQARRQPRERHSPGYPRSGRRGDARSVLLVAAAAWAIWFFWFLSN